MSDPWEAPARLVPAGKQVHSRTGWRILAENIRRREESLFLFVDGSTEARNHDEPIQVRDATP